MQQVDVTGVPLSYERQEDSALLHLTTSFEGVNIKLKIKGNGDERLLQAKRVTARGQFSGEALGIFVPAVIWSFYDPPEGSALEEIGERWEL